MFAIIDLYNFIQVVGRKSLQQLMCEQKESSPLERSKLVKDYLRDKHQGDERVKKSYKKLKEQLNTLGHFHMDIQYNKVIKFCTLIM